MYQMEGWMSLVISLTMLFALGSSLSIPRAPSEPLTTCIQKFADAYQDSLQAYVAVDRCGVGYPAMMCQLGFGR